jgi:hypothetical protein
VINTTPKALTQGMIPITWVDVDNFHQIVDVVDMIKLE